MRFVFLAIRQHFLERLKSLSLIAVIAVTFYAAAFPNNLGTSSLFWPANWFYYAQSCIFLGLLGATWTWISLLLDTGRQWLIKPSPIYFLVQVARRLNRILATVGLPRLPEEYEWSFLRSFNRREVFCYLAVSNALISSVLAAAHAVHLNSVTLPATGLYPWLAFLLTFLVVFLSSLIALFVLVGLSEFVDRSLIRTVTAPVLSGLETLANDVHRSGFDYDVKGRDSSGNDVIAFAWLHQVGSLAFAVFSLFWICFLLCAWLFGGAWIGGSASMHFCLMVCLVCHALGFSLYRQRTGGPWFGLLTVIAVIALFVFGTPEYQIRGLSSINRHDGAIVRRSIDEALQASKRMAVSASTSQADAGGVGQAANRGPLVVVSVSGGGIRAQIWALATLCALDNTLDDFSNQCYLVTGASGGMVGATHFVASLSPEPLDPDDYLRFLHQATRDTLTRTFATHIMNDVMGAIPRNLFRRLGWKPTKNFIQDRGAVLEQEWIKHTTMENPDGSTSSVFGLTLDELARDEKELKALSSSNPDRWRPVLAYAPVIAEEGRRLLICNQRLDGLVSTRTRMIDKADDRTEKLLSVDSIHLQDIDPSGWGKMRLATAARLNANFPFVVSSPEIAKGRLSYKSWWNALTDRIGIDTTRSLHIIDGGYYDNYGINQAARWVEENRLRIREAGFSGVLLLQISSSDRGRLSPIGTASSFPELSYVGVGFQKTTFLTDFQIHDLNAKFNTGLSASETPYFAFCSVEFEGPVSLSWSLTPAEIYALLKPYLDDTGGNDRPTSLNRRTDDLLSLSPLLDVDEEGPSREFVEELNAGKEIFEHARDRAFPTSGQRSSRAQAEFNAVDETVKRIRRQFAGLKTWWDAKSSPGDQN
ncbi:MAG: hypothetical protein AAF802_16740 [Planctomycetota bacterium]